MLEDNPLDSLAIEKILSSENIGAVFVKVKTGKDYVSKLEQESFDLILSDHQLPDFDSIQALQARNKMQPAVPFILITGALPEEVAMAIIKEGGDDYILKDRLQRLPIAVKEAVNKRRTEEVKQSLETALAELTERFQLAAKTSPDIIWDYDVLKNSIYCSDALEKIIGVTSSENFDIDWLLTFIHPEDLPAVKTSFAKMIKSSDHRWRKIFRVLKKDGSVGWMNSNALVIRNKQDFACRVVGVMHDITEVRRLQHELIERELQVQKQITEITIQAQEKERLEIGRELHDNVNQLLATSKIMIDTAKSSEEIHDVCLEKAQESIMQAITELRNLAHSMMTPPFEKKGFVNVIKDLAFKVNLTGKVNLEVVFPPQEMLHSISENIQLAFYRIIQEQVANILKYSKAGNASIEIEADENCLSLVVEDDGVGFDVNKIEKGIGLKNMESRAKLLNGNFTIISFPGEGCVVRVKIPVTGEVLSC